MSVGPCVYACACTLLCVCACACAYICSSMRCVRTYVCGPVRACVHACVRACVFSDFLLIGSYLQISTSDIIFDSTGLPCYFWRLRMRKVNYSFLHLYTSYQAMRESTRISHVCAHLFTRVTKYCPMSESPSSVRLRYLIVCWSHEMPTHTQPREG